MKISIYIVPFMVAFGGILESAEHRLPSPTVLRQWLETSGAHLTYLAYDGIEEWAGSLEGKQITKTTTNEIAKDILHAYLEYRYLRFNIDYPAYPLISSNCEIKEYKIAICSMLQEHFPDFFAP